MKERESFIFYRSFFLSVDRLPEDMQLPLYKAIAQYALDRIEPDFSNSRHLQFIEAIWDGIKPQLDANYRRFVNGCSGGAPKGNKNNPFGRTGKRREKRSETTEKQPKNNQELTEKQPNVNDNVNVNENIEKKLNKENGFSFPYSSDKFLSTWEELRSQPHWRKKTHSALQKNLDKLKEFPEPEAIDLMIRTIAGGYQGIPYPKKKYKSGNTDSPSDIQTTIPEFKPIDELYK